MSGSSPKASSRVPLAATLVKQNIICEDCHVGFATVSSFEEHSQMSSIPDKTCSYCPQTFPSECSLSAHRLSHINLKVPIQYPKRRKASSPKASLAMVKNIFVCKVCGRTFKHRSSFRAHEPTHTGVKPFQCNICKRSFALQWNLVSHLHTHTGVRRYKCHKCNAYFARSTTLREHMQVHLPLHEKPICRCETCGKEFRSKKSLSGHRVVHRKKRPFTCDICDRGFVSRRNLRNHQKIHLSCRLFRCDACDVYFRTTVNLAIHRAERHFTPEYTNFPTIISEMAYKIESLAKEQNLETQYPCETCEKQFSLKQTWVKHMQTHFIDQYRCICYVCGEGNSNLEELRSHLETHSEGVPPPPCTSPPKLSVSNYDIKYFINFFSNNGIDIVKNDSKLFSEPPPPPPYPTGCLEGVENK